MTRPKLRVIEGGAEEILSDDAYQDYLVERLKTRWRRRAWTAFLVVVFFLFSIVAFWLRRC